MKLPKFLDIPLKDALFIGFCALFVVFGKLLTRWGLKISGHSLLLTVFFMMIAAACVKNRFAATITGFTAGLISVAVGIGKSGPLFIAKLVAPGLIIDIAIIIYPALVISYPLTFLVGALASSTKFLFLYVEDILLGMDEDVLILHVLYKTGSSILFGAVGGLLVPPIIKKLRAHGIIDAEEDESLT